MEERKGEERVRGKVKKGEKEKRRKGGIIGKRKRGGIWDGEEEERKKARRMKRKGREERKIEEEIGIYKKEEKERKREKIRVGKREEKEIKEIKEAIEEREGEKIAKEIGEKIKEGRIGKIVEILKIISKRVRGMRIEIKGRGRKKERKERWVIGERIKRNQEIGRRYGKEEVETKYGVSSVKVWIER